MKIETEIRLLIASVDTFNELIDMLIAASLYHISKK
mgnify:CR=1 FL=1